MRTSALADDAAGHVDELVHSSLQQSAAQSANLVETQVATVTQRMAVELAVAQQRLVDSGGVSFGDPVAWTAKDQVSGEVSQLSLPAVRVGGLWLGQNADLTAPTAFVDDTAGLLDAAVTVFQRMDESGNMLRVATSVPTADGTRAIGTYIPATGADATPNAVVTSLLAGQPYYGTASVVGAPYVTAYAPIVAGDQVVGALFVGIPQSEVDAPLRESLAGVTLGETGGLTVLDKDGAQLVPSDGPAVLTEQDAGALVADAVALADGEQLDRQIVAGGTAATAEVVHVAAWGWTIVAWMPDSEVGAVSATLQDGARGIGVQLLLVGGLVAALASCLVVWQSGRVVRRIARVTGALRRVADGDLTVSVGAETAGTRGTDGEDEIAVMNGALTDAVTSMRTAVGQMRQGADQVLSTARRLDGSSTTLADVAGATSALADTVSGSATVVSSEVQAITAAMTELRTTIEHVAQDVAAASSQAAGSVSEAAEAAGAATRLAESSSQIGAVVSAVAAIAGQTHMLALNATIEAARAGEAGRGFAVVAGEVKDLARQTSNALETIGPLLSAVERDAADVQEAVARIGQSIGLVDDHQSSMAAVVEQQAATTSDVERNLVVAATSTQEIAGSMAQVAQDVSRSRAEAGDVQGAVASLTSVAEELEAQVARFSLEA
ncbi:methyl-accepting chemotaxis protein [Cellulomonas soli]